MENSCSFAAFLLVLLSGSSGFTGSRTQEDVTFSKKRVQAAPGAPGTPRGPEPTGGARSFHPSAKASRPGHWS